jgi:hypothetical protein
MALGHKAVIDLLDGRHPLVKILQRYQTLQSRFLAEMFHYIVNGQISALLSLSILTTQALTVRPTSGLQRTLDWLTGPDTHSVMVCGLMV